MATLETQQVDEVIASSRRRMLTLGGAALAGIALSSIADAQSSALTDTDILNFALNLEYLEGNYYTLAATGQTLDGAGIGITGTGTQGTVTTKAGGPAACKVPFSNTLVQGYASEIAKDEQNHVTFLRSALGSAAVAQPPIDLYNSFNTLAAALNLGVTAFDPFANDISFLIGAYVFEVGVSAYTGAAPLITSSAILDSAAGIQAVEAYHYGLIRTTIAALDQSDTPLGPSGTANKVATAISALRASLDGTGTSASPRGDDLGLQGQMVALNGLTALGTGYQATTITNASTTTFSTTSAAPSGSGTSGSLATARTPTQVLSIVFAGGKGMGGFFPAGVNVTATAS